MPIRINKMSTNTSSFQFYLQEELKRRSNANKYYSIRAFARDLGINDSTLAKLLEGKLKISAKRIQSLGSKLSLCQNKIKVLIATLNSKYTPTIKMTYQQLQMDQFKAASDWYHNTIIELAKLDRIKASAKNVSALLSINFLKTREAIDRLVRLGAISIDTDGFLNCELKHSLMNYEDNIYTSDLLKHYQRKILKQSIKAIEKTQKPNRVHNSMILSIDSSKLDEFHELMRKQQQELLAFIKENNNNKDSVYAIQFSSFPLTSNRE